MQIGEKHREQQTGARQLVVLWVFPFDTEKASVRDAGTPCRGLGIKVGHSSGGFASGVWAPCHLSVATADLQCLTGSPAPTVPTCRAEWEQAAVGLFLTEKPSDGYAPGGLLWSLLHPPASAVLLRVGKGGGKGKAEAPGLAGSVKIAVELCKSMLHLCHVSCGA